MKITNINGTSDNTCKCGSWLQHWKNFSGEPIPQYCPVVGCMNRDILGAHVQKDSSYDKKWYIFPICSSCNKEYGKTLTVSDSYSLVSANVSETCGK